MEENEGKEVVCACILREHLVYRIGGMAGGSGTALQQFRWVGCMHWHVKPHISSWLRSS